MVGGELALQAGAIIADRYEVVEEIASGGSGIVYRVRDMRASVVLALKCLRADKTEPRDVKLFRDEYRTLCQLTHPRIVSVYDYGVCASGAYYTMELLDGLDVREAAPLPVLDVCRLLRDAASALAMLHARRLLHRDVSFRNVRCTAGGCAKLIDFGAMTPIGTAADVIGTPPFIPPEALNGNALEPRADLYSLGALAYWMLTARHAYPASNLQMLRQLWAAGAPTQVASLIPGVPLELDRLIMSMLSQDPQGRPASAAEVMDRLGAIANLPPAEELGVAAAYLAKPALVGRERERTRIREYLRRDVETARLGPLLIIGAEGVGKTRMLEELMIEAKLAGWVPICSRKSATSEPYSLVRELLDQLSANLPDLASAIADEDRALLAGHFAGFGAPNAGAQTLSLGELRIRLQAALARCFVRATRNTRLCIAVDDFQRVDDESVSLLAALATEISAANLWLALTMPPAHAGETTALRMMRQLGVALRLGKLAPTEVNQLIDSLFGDVPNTQRVAHWMYERTRGNPLECSELARYLVACGLVHYTEGTWILPAVLPREVPRGLEETRKARFAALAPDQRAIAEATAIYAAPITLEVCAQISGVHEADALRALDALVHLELLREDAGEYLVRAEALRAEIERGLPPAHAQLLHERAGQLLLVAAGLDFHPQVRAAHHLMRGVSRRRGADRIAALARDPNVARDISEAFNAPLELAFSIYCEQHVPPSETTPLLIRLMNAAFLYDHSLIHYSAQLVPQLWRDAGLDLLSTLDRNRPDWLAELIERATERYHATALSARGLAPSEALTTLSGISVLVLAAGILKAEIPLVQKAWDAVEPLARLGSTSPLAAAPELVGIGLRALQMGESADHEQRVAYLERLRKLENYPGFPEARRLSIMCSQLHNIGMATSALDGATAMRLADQIDQSGLQMYRGAALQVRFMVHMYRGELDLAEQCRSRLDILAVQGGAGTQFELWLAPYLADPYALWDDVLGLKRAAAHLQRLAAHDSGYMPMALTALGHHCRVRGDHRGALAAFEQARALAPRDQHAGWLLALSGHIDALVDAGQFEAALSFGLELLNSLDYAERFTAIIQQRMARSIALAEAHAGRIEQAIARIERAIEQEEGLGKSPLHLGRLHEARARMALLEHDGASFSEHLLKVRGYFVQTRNPALIKRYDRLATLGRSQFPAAAAITSEGDLYAHNALLSLAELNVPQQRAELALELILREAQVEEGFLFLKRGVQLELAASMSERPPPSDLHTMLTTLVMDMEDAVGRTLTVSLAPPPSTGLETTTLMCGRLEFVPMPLLVTIDGSRELVGIVAIPYGGTGSLKLPHGHLINAISASLYLSTPPSDAP
jgi:tetratricopeptide (TPR) repeat protein